MNCPLCNTQILDPLESLSFELIREMYKRHLGVIIPRGDDLSLLQCAGCSLKFFVPPTAGNGDFYKQLQRFPWYYLSEKSEYDIALRFIQPSDSVLEVGAGTGALAKKLNTQRYAGLELSDAAVEHAAKNGVTLLNQTIEAHAIDHKQKYDVVCSFQVLEHVPSVRSYLTSCLDCLRPGGTMIHSVPSDDSFMGFEVNNVLNMPPHHVTRWPDKTLLRIPELFGLEFVDLIHEELMPLHRRSFKTAVIHQKMNRSLGRKPRTLDPLYGRIDMRLITRLLTCISATSSLDHQELGHSVVAVYKKPLLKQV